MNDYRERIKELIIDSINQFKYGCMDFNTLSNNIIGNVEALDNLDKSIKKAVIRLCGELEVIHFTVELNQEHEAMMKELSKFEPFIYKI